MGYRGQTHTETFGESVETSRERLGWGKDTWWVLHWLGLVLAHDASTEDPISKFESVR